MESVYVKDLSRLSDAELLTAYLNNDEAEAPESGNVEDKCYIAEFFRRILKIQEEEISPYNTDIKKRYYTNSAVAELTTLLNNAG